MSRQKAFLLLGSSFASAVCFGIWMDSFMAGLFVHFCTTFVIVLTHKD